MAQKRLQGGEGPQVALQTIDQLQEDVISPDDQAYLDEEKKKAQDAHQLNLGKAAEIARTLSEAEEQGRSDSDWTRPQDK